MNEIINIDKKELLDAVLVYDKIKADRKGYTKYTTWVSRQITAWGFIEGKDFISILGKSSGGRRPVNYYITLDMAKHLCMLDKSDIGMNARDYYISVEKEYKQHKLVRLIGKELRKTLTDRIKEAGENERMHGFGYSNYTKLAYNLCGIEYVKTESFRDTLTDEQLSKVKTVEKMIESLLEIGKQYKEIKNVLEPIFKDVDIKGLKE